MHGTGQVDDEEHAMLTSAAICVSRSLVWSPWSRSLSSVRTAPRSTVVSGWGSVTSFLFCSLGACVCVCVAAGRRVRRPEAPTTTTKDRKRRIDIGTWHGVRHAREPCTLSWYSCASVRQGQHSRGMLDACMHVQTSPARLAAC